MTTPIHLSGAKCGDRVLWHDQPFGIIHCWAKDGCSVRLENPTSVTYIAGKDSNGTFSEAFRVLQVLVTNEMFASGEFTVVKVKED